MYLIEPRLSDIVKKQVRYKFNAYTGVFTSLLVMQLIGILLGFGSGGYSSHSDTLVVDMTTSSNDLTVVLTFLWAISTGVLVTTTAYRNDAFVFVTNRLSHHLSSILFLLAASTIAGILAVLNGSLIKFITISKHGYLFSEYPSIFGSPVDFFIQIGTAILYIVLIAATGYAIGSFVQRSKLFVPIIIILIFVLPFINIRLSGTVFIEKMVTFFGAETSLAIFLLKVVVTVLALFTVSIAVTNNKEVRN